MVFMFVRIVGTFGIYSGFILSVAQARGPFGGFLLYRDVNPFLVRSDRDNGTPNC